MPSSVVEIAPADSAAALAHFEGALRFETDCWDVHDAMSNGRQDFVLVDVRSHDLYANAHVPGAVSIPVEMTASVGSALPRDALIVTLCT